MALTGRPFRLVYWDRISTLSDFRYHDIVGLRVVSVLLPVNSSTISSYFLTSCVGSPASMIVLEIDIMIVEELSAIKKSTCVEQRCRGGIVWFRVDGFVVVLLRLGFV